MPLPQNSIFPLLLLLYNFDTESFFIFLGLIFFLNYYQFWVIIYLPFLLQNILPGNLCFLKRLQFKSTTYWLNRLKAKWFWKKSSHIMPEAKITTVNKKEKNLKSKRLNSYSHYKETKENLYAIASKQKRKTCFQKTKVYESERNSIFCMHSSKNPRRDDEKSLLPSKKYIEKTSKHLWKKKLENCYESKKRTMYVILRLIFLDTSCLLPLFSSCPSLERKHLSKYYRAKDFPFNSLLRFDDEKTKQLSVLESVYKFDGRRESLP